VMALLKNHNHQLCLTSKEYNTLKSNHTGYRHYRPLSPSGSPIHRASRPITSINSPGPNSPSSVIDRNLYSATTIIPTTKSHLCARIKQLRTEFALMACKHQKLNDK
ncbi:unnamed protein product, partial [Didymodactylos carnosus]